MSVFYLSFHTVWYSQTGSSLHILATDFTVIHAWFVVLFLWHRECLYKGADKSLAQPTSRCILFDGENISFDASLVIYINSTNIPPVMIINRIYENQNLLSL